MKADRVQFISPPKYYSKNWGSYAYWIMAIEPIGSANEQLSDVIKQDKQNGPPPFPDDVEIPITIDEMHGIKIPSGAFNCTILVYLPLGQEIYKISYFDASLGYSNVCKNDELPQIFRHALETLSLMH